MLGDLNNTLSVSQTLPPERDRTHDLSCDRTSPGALDGAPATPDDWLARIGQPPADPPGPGDPPSPRWVGLGDLVGDGDRSMAELHHRLGAEHRVPPASAAMYLAAWFPGRIAELVGLALATVRAGFLVDLERVRWHLDEGGRPERIDVGHCEIAVADGHPWVGRPRVSLAGTTDEVVRRTIDVLVDATAPLVETCRRLAPVGRAGLWNEVGDGLAMGLVRHDGRIEVDEEMIAVVTGAARLPGVPWRTHARLWLIDTAWGRACVGRKGGCCLAYRLPSEAFEHDGSNPDLVEFRRRFPLDDGAPQYCGACSFRDPDDAAARQLFWLERSRRSR